MATHSAIKYSALAHVYRLNKLSSIFSDDQAGRISDNDAPASACCHKTAHKYRIMKNKWKYSSFLKKGNYKGAMLSIKIQTPLFIHVAFISFKLIFKLFACVSKRMWKIKNRF